MVTNHGAQCTSRGSQDSGSKSRLLCSLLNPRLALMLLSGKTRTFDLSPSPALSLRVTQLTSSPDRTIFLRAQRLGGRDQLGTESLHVGMKITVK